MKVAGSADRWEAAYLRFETPAQETRKFFLRLERLGRTRWPAAGRTVELFCGRGSGLAALAAAGFPRLSGADLSLSLLSEFCGSAALVAADCRRLPYADGSHDIAIIQGGLHHLEQIPEDLEQTLSEAHRILRAGGRFVAVEPWLTPFLSAVHFLCRRAIVRGLWGRVDALSTMIEHEKTTYEQWLAAPETVLRLLKERFEPEVCFRRWGKLYFVGRKSPLPAGMPL